jgi:hypothetical protein
MDEETVSNVLLVSEFFGGEVWFIEWTQDCWLLVCDEETVVNVFLIGYIFAGDGGIPHTPPPEEEPSPDPWNQIHRSVV